MTTTQLSVIAPSFAVLGALIVAVANFLVQKWRYHLDRLSAAVDNLCHEVNNAGDIATRYWLLNSLTNPQDLAEIKRLEPQLLGCQMLIQQLILAIRLQDRRMHLTAVETALVDFYDALTGGQFRSKVRSDDPDRALRVKLVAAEFNGELRAALSVRARFIA